MKAKQNKGIIPAAPSVTVIPQSTETASPAGWDKVDTSTPDSVALETVPFAQRLADGIDEIPGIIPGAIVDTTTASAETESSRFQRDVDSLMWAKYVRCMSLTDYVAQGRTDEERATRKKEWNKAKAVENRIAGKAMDAATVSHEVRVKLNGNHSIRSKGKPLEGTAAEYVAEKLKSERLTFARSVIHSGTGADGIPTHGMNAQQLDDIAHCAKQDGLVREPHKSALYHPRHAILSFNDSTGKTVVDKKAAMRWLEWRDTEILMQQEAAAELVRAQMENAQH